jgi:hypothetical protein
MTTAFRGNAKPSRPSFPPPVPTAEVPEPDAALPPAQRAHALYTAAAQQFAGWRAAHSPDIDPDVLKANAGAFAPRRSSPSSYPPHCLLSLPTQSTRSSGYGTRSTVRPSNRRTRRGRPACGRGPCDCWTVSQVLPRYPLLRGIWLPTRIPPTWPCCARNCRATWSRGQRRVIGWIPHWPRRSPALPTLWPNPS